MNYKKDELLKFSRANIKLFDEKYEMFLTKAEDLVGKKVVSIRSGFSTFDGGQVMIVEELKYYKEILNVILKPCEESSLSEDERKSHNGWCCRYDERCSSFVFHIPKKS